MREWTAEESRGHPEQDEDVLREEHPYRFGYLGNLALPRRLTGNLTEVRPFDEQALVGCANCSPVTIITH